MEVRLIKKNELGASTFMVISGGWETRLLASDVADCIYRVNKYGAFMEWLPRKNVWS